MSALLPAERRDETPAAVIEPWPHVRRALRREAVQIGERPLQSDRRRMRRADGGEHAVGAGKPQHTDVRLGDGEADGAAVAPEIDQPRLAGGKLCYRFNKWLCRRRSCRGASANSIPCANITRAATQGERAHTKIRPRPAKPALASRARAGNFPTLDSIEDPP